MKRFRRNSGAFFLLSELLPKFLPHIARTVHEKALRDRVYQKGEYEVRRKSAVRAVGMFLLAALAILILCRYQHTSVVRPKDRFSGQIPQLHSTADADGTGQWQGGDMVVFERHIGIVGHYRISE